MGLYSSPPQLRSFAEDKPTLLVCWWITIFCATIILLRLAGRFIRSELLYLEDKTAGLAIIPLFIRMGFVHVILNYGTNNVQLDGVILPDEDLHRRSVGSGLVLASRFFHAITLWILKIAILEFFRRISEALSQKFSHITLIFIRFTIGATFIAVIVSNLAECHPFSHYWQVLPDPGGRCRQGYAQLLTVSVCNVFTDLLLVLFPVPIILFSHLSVKRKCQLISLFSISLGVVGATVYRVNFVIKAHGSQQTRSLLASVELLFATIASNALVLGTFVRDRGLKKNKFRAGSVADSMDRTSIARSRRPTMNHHWGSLEDLVRDVGIGVNPDLHTEGPPADDVIFGGTTAVRNRQSTPVVAVEDSAQPAQPAHPAHPVQPTPPTTAKVPEPESGEPESGGVGVSDMNTWQFSDRPTSGATRSALSGHSGHSDDDALLSRDPHSASSRSISTTTPRRVSFFEAGGPLPETDAEGDRRRNPTIYENNFLLSPNSVGSAYSENETTPPSPAFTAGSHGFRRGSSALLQDIGGLLGPLSPRQRPKSGSKSPTDLSSVSEGYFHRTTTAGSVSSSTHYMSRSNMDDIVLADPGGLLKPQRRR